MLQAQRKKSYRISDNRRRMSHAEAIRGVHMHIDSPVLQQYNSIDLGATIRSHRINHKTLSTSASACPQRQNRFKTKWETLIDRYIQSKQKIQEKKGISNASFQFLKLDRTNRFRYIRLARNEALPFDAAKICKITDQLSVNKQKAAKRIKTDNPTSAYTKQSRIAIKVDFGLQNIKSPKNEKEKLLDYFVQNYFKNKCRKDVRQSSLTNKAIQQKSTYFTRSLMRNNTD